VRALQIEPSAVLEHVVADEDGHDHGVRTVSPSDVQECAQLVVRRVARHPEVHHLDAARRLDAREEGLVEPDLERLDERVAEHDDARDAVPAREISRPIALSERVHLDPIARHRVSRSVADGGLGDGAGHERPAHARIRLPERRLSLAVHCRERDPKPNLEHDERAGGDRRDDEPAESTPHECGGLATYAPVVKRVRG
jgi:hypothetical protein